MNDISISIDNNAEASYIHRLMIDRTFDIYSKYISSYILYNDAVLYNPVKKYEHMNFVVYAVAVDHIPGITHLIHREDGPAVHLRRNHHSQWTYRYLWWYKHMPYSFLDWLERTTISDEEKAILKMKYACK